MQNRNNIDLLILEKKLINLCNEFLFFSISRYRQINNIPALNNLSIPKYCLENKASYIML